MKTRVIAVRKPVYSVPPFRCLFCIDFWFWRPQTAALLDANLVRASLSLRLLILTSSITHSSAWQHIPAPVIPHFLPRMASSATRPAPAHSYHLATQEPLVQRRSMSVCASSSRPSSTSCLSWLNMNSFWAIYSHIQHPALTLSSD